MSYKIAIFDMDGTVLNTIDDLCDAMNYAVNEAGYQINFTVDDTKQFFGSGVEVAIKRALAIYYGASYESLVDVGTINEKLPEEVTIDEVNRISEIYRPYYAAHCDIKTGPYKGIPEAIKELRKNGILTAVVSNKPDAAVQKLVADDFDGLFDFSLGEKQGIKRKPSPAMVDYSIMQLLRTGSGMDIIQKATPLRKHFTLDGDIREHEEDVLQSVKPQAVYIGDSEIDIQTANNSGLDCISVDWGFRSIGFLKNNNAKVIVSSPEEMAEKILYA